MISQTKISQSNEIAFQLITQVANTMAQSPSLSGFTDELWYLFGYPDAVKQGVDAPFVNKVVAATGGSSQVVTVFAAQRFVGAPLILQQGVWVLARIPTVIAETIISGGGIIADLNLLNDGYLRLVYDVTSNVKIYSRFNNTKQLRIIANGVVIFDANPLPGVPTPLVPIQDNTNAYTPQGVHFDGATGLVTAAPLVTKNTGIISFAGWFNIDPSVNGVLKFSQGSGSNTLFYNTSLPASVWCHMLGTIDAQANSAFLLINGATASGNPAAVGGAFSSAPTNGKNLYIGTDTQGNFYKGDIADLSIWFDVSFIELSGVDPIDFAKLVLVNTTLQGVTTIQPTNPLSYLFGFNVLIHPGLEGANNIKSLVQPDIFLSGPASTALTPETLIGTRVQTIQNLNVVSGALTNSSTNPSKITVVPT